MIIIITMSIAHATSVGLIYVPLVSVFAHCHFAFGCRAHVGA